MAGGRSSRIYRACKQYMFSPPVSRHFRRRQRRLSLFQGQAALFYAVWYWSTLYYSQMKMAQDAKRIVHSG